MESNSARKEVARLRERADHVRYLASGVSSSAALEGMLEYAAELDAKADKLQVEDAPDAAAALKPPAEEPDTK